MSAIQKELCKATGVDAPKKNEDRQSFLLKLLRATGKLGDAEWDELTKAAQKWFNAAADAKNAKADEVPDFPDLEEEEDEEPAPRSRKAKGEEDDAPRSRKSNDDDEAAPTGTKEIDPDDVKEGMAVRVLTKRGKDVSGTVVEAGDELVVKQGNGEELEFSWKGVDKIFGLETATSKSRKAKEEPEDPVSVGAKVKVVTKRGKEVTGTITELDDDVIVIKNEEGESSEFDRERVESITPVGSGKAKSNADNEDEAPARRSSKSKEKEEGESKRSSNPEGVSIATRVAELMVENLDASEEEIGKMLTKEGVAYRGNTLNLNYKATKKLLDLLQKKKMLKV